MGRSYECSRRPSRSFGDVGSMSGLPESDTAASFHEPHDEVPCPIIKCCAAVPPISATTMSAASTTNLSTRPAIQFGVSSPHDQSSEAPFGRATVRRWESEYPAASIPPPFAAPTVRRSSFRPGQEQADVLSERPPHGRREPIDRHHCGLALPRVL